MALGALRVVEAGARVYRRTWRGSVISTFLNPILFLLAMGVGLGKLVDEGSGTATLDIPYLTFLAPGHKPRDIRQHKFPEGTPEALRALHGLLSQLGPEVRIDLPNFRLVRFLSTGEAVLYDDPAQHHLLQRIYDLILDEPEVEAHFVGHPLREVRGGIISLEKFI
jgi:hypothetical protein